MNEKKIKNIFFLAAAALLAGCPEQVGAQCPTNSSSLGNFNIYFQGQHPSGECTVAQTDGGANPLVAEDGGTRTATLCYGAASDGGGQVHLIIPTKGDRVSDLLPDGGFLFTAANTAVVGTACDSLDGGACPIDIAETFGGYLLTAGDAGFGVLPDGGLPLVTGISGSFVDALSTTDKTHCLCNVPCAVTYGISAAPF